MAAERRFLDWLRSASVDVSKINWPTVFESHDSQERGVATKVALRGGEEIVRIPAHLMLIPARCLSDPVLSRLRIHLLTAPSTVDLEDYDDLTVRCVCVYVYRLATMTTPACVNSWLYSFLLRLLVAWLVRPVFGGPMCAFSLHPRHFRASLRHGVLLMCGFVPTVN